ncbi:hypothetical protein EVG20_g9109 [Dentipellis fragilis]|uniref:Uncharacterized protein n=1 Tax=Dentipellis fragilis TaxID=205917 RepID=A0A4Y9Y1N3_9AGAM|nr:hypothetical protein EVG20_g9109 [Dentipellis fragilis]
MQPSHYLSGHGTRTSPNAGAYRNKPAGQSSGLQPLNTNQYQQTPTRVQNSKAGFAGCTSHSSVPILYKKLPGSRNPAAHSPCFESSASAPTTSERWEDATSEFQVPAYKHEVPSCLYTSRFSANPYDTTLRDKAPRIWSPSDEDSDDGSPEPHEILRSQSRPTDCYGARAERYETRTDSQSVQKPVAQARTGGRAPRTAEQKARIAKSAANRRAKDKDNLAVIKGRLPPLAYEEYNNRTALEGAIKRFDRDEETIRALEVECASYERRWRDIDAMLTSERRRWVSTKANRCHEHGNADMPPKNEERSSLIGQRDYLLAQWKTVQSVLENMKLSIAQRDAELQSNSANLEILNATVERTATELRYLKGKSRLT